MTVTIDPRGAYPADVLREALHRLDGGKNWAKGPKPWQQGAACAMTALQALEDSDEGELAVSDAMRLLVTAMPPRPYRY